MAPRVVFDLDELEELNPEPAAFRIGGKTLLAGEVPHPRLIAIQRRAAEMEERFHGIAPTDAGELEVALDGLIDVVWDLFAPFTAWLPATRHWEHRTSAERIEVEPDDPREWRRVDFFSDVPLRKLIFLMQKGFEEQLRLGALVPNGDPEDPDDPPVGAGRQPAGRTSTRR